MKVLLLATWATLALVQTAHGENRPTIGMLYNTKETGSLNYECYPEGDTLACEFVQISVRVKTPPAQVASELEKAKKGLADFQKGIDKKECAQIESFDAALKKGEPPPGVDLKWFKADMQPASPLQKKDLEKSMGSLVQYCRDPSDESYLAIVRHQLDVESRTCLISANPYKQRFKQVAGSDVWVVVQDGPKGECGLVNVSRFEMDKSVDLPFWRYFAKKVVTNKSRAILILPGMTCADLDENEYEYDWRSKDKQISCDYLSFGAF